MRGTIVLSSVIQRDPEMEAILKPLVTAVKIEAKQVINLPEDNLGGMYYIHSGNTRHYMTSKDGTEKMLYFLYPGWLFGESLHLLGKATELTTMAATDLELWKISAENCKKLLEECSQFKQLVLQCLSYKLQYLHQEVESLCFDSCKERLLHVLFVSVNNEHLVDDAWYNLEINYSHYDLAVQIGSVRVTVSKLLKELCDENIIRTVNRKIQVNAKAYESYLKR